MAAVPSGVSRIAKTDKGITMLHSGGMNLLELGTPAYNAMFDLIDVAELSLAEKIEKRRLVDAKRNTPAPPILKKPSFWDRLTRGLKPSAPATVKVKYAPAPLPPAAVAPDEGPRRPTPPSAEQYRDSALARRLGLVRDEHSVGDPMLFLHEWELVQGKDGVFARGTIAGHPHFPDGSIIDTPYVTAYDKEQNLFRAQNGAIISLGVVRPGTEAKQSELLEKTKKVLSAPESAKMLSRDEIPTVQSIAVQGDDVCIRFANRMSMKFPLKEPVGLVFGQTARTIAESAKLDLDWGGNFRIKPPQPNLPKQPTTPSRSTAPSASPSTPAPTTPNPPSVTPHEQFKRSERQKGPFAERRADGTISPTPHGIAALESSIPMEPVKVSFDGAAAMIDRVKAHFERGVLRLDCVGQYEYDDCVNEVFTVTEEPYKSVFEYAAGQSGFVLKQSEGKELSKRDTAIAGELGNRLNSFLGPFPEAAREKTAPAAEHGAINEEQRADILKALRVIAGVDDGARKRDDTGFNRDHTQIGRELASLKTLSPAQAAVARDLVRFYKRQVIETDPALLERAVAGAKGKMDISAEALSARLAGKGVEVSNATDSKKTAPARQASVDEEINASASTMNMSAEERAIEAEMAESSSVPDQLPPDVIKGSITLAIPPQDGGPDMYVYEVNAGDQRRRVTIGKEYDRDLIALDACRMIKEVVIQGNEIQSLVHRDGRLLSFTEASELAKPLHAMRSKEIVKPTAESPGFVQFKPSPENETAGPGIEPS